MAFVKIFNIGIPIYVSQVVLAIHTHNRNGKQMFRVKPRHGVAAGHYNERIIPLGRLIAQITHGRHDIDDMMSALCHLEYAVQKHTCLWRVT